MQVKPSRHVPRSHRVHFEGSPASGRIVVRCPSEQDFNLVKTAKGWVVTLGSGFMSCIYPKVQPNRNPFIVYLSAVKALWGIDTKLNIWDLPEAPF